MKYDYQYEEEGYKRFKNEDDDHKKCKKEEDDHRKCKKEEDDHRKCKEEDGCSKTIKKDVSLVAMVKVKPIIRIHEHEIEVKCVGPVHFDECKKHSIKKECEFCIKQDLSIRVPVRFDAETEVKEQGIVCHSDEHCEEK